MNFAKIKIFLKVFLVAISQKNIVYFRSDGTINGLQSVPCSNPSSAAQRPSHGSRQRPLLRLNNLSYSRHCQSPRRSNQRLGREGEWSAFAQHHHWPLNFGSQPENSRQRPRRFDSFGGFDLLLRGRVQAFRGKKFVFETTCFDEVLFRIANFDRI